MNVILKTRESNGISNDKTIVSPLPHYYSKENFPCGPSKVPMLKRKIGEVINAKVDPNTLNLKALDCTKPENFEAAPCKTRSLALLEDLSDTLKSEIDEVISEERKEENLRYLRYEVPYFKDFSDDEFYDLMDKVS